jgi:hypothetical protein
MILKAKLVMDVVLCLDKDPMMPMRDEHRAQLAERHLWVEWKPGAKTTGNLKVGFGGALTYKDGGRPEHSIQVVGACLAFD